MEDIHPATDIPARRSTPKLTLGLVIDVTGEVCWHLRA